jgi:uncharacterized protein with GYD domain
VPKFVSFFSYSGDAWGKMARNPSDREEATRKLIESAGGKLETYYWMFGEYDGFAIYDAPDHVTAGAIPVAAASSGAIKAIRTHQLITKAEARQMLEKAGRAAASYQPPG